MAETRRSYCRRAAAECVRLARLTTDPDTKQTLSTRAQEWLKLAYSDHDDEFERLLGDFNAQQMAAEQSAAHRAPRRQAMQQQQAKVRGEE
jgi:ubiquinone biosynthesis protein UbiJ